MEFPVQHSAEEIKRLQRCINDLVSILALPAIWSGGEPSQIVDTLLDALMGMLRLDLVYVRLKDPLEETPLEMARFAPSRKLTASPREIGKVLNFWLDDDPQGGPSLVQNPLGDEEISIMSLRLGLRGEIGVIVTGSHRTDFPSQTERLLLSVAANQAAIGLQGARLLNEQKRVANELDRRVAQRTAELASANEELKREIADRRLMEEKLRREEKELKRSEALLAESQRLSLTGSFMWRVVTDEITWSDQSYRIFQIDRTTPVTFELINNRVHPEDLPTFKEQLERARGDGSDVEFDLRLQLPDRSIRYIHVVARATRDESGQLEYIGAVQDVTERRLAEAALGKARSELAHVARVTSLGALTASIAHEVNQPLSGIITNAATCLRMLAADPPNIDGAFETARRTIRDGHRASDVIARLRALFAKKDTTMESVDLNEAAREVIALSLSELQRSRIVVRSELADDLPPITGDRVQLQQVILNLLLNASDAMSGVEGRPRQLTVHTERDGGDRVRLTVQDTGMGVDPKILDRLFDAFYTTKSAGMGMGLSVSRSIIENHRGRLWAVPHDGPGATFSFSIPQACEHGETSHSMVAIQAPALTDTEPVRRSS